MPSKLDMLLESIDPARTLDRVSADVDRAINSFSMSRGTIEDWDEYKEYLTDFCRHIEHAVLHLSIMIDERKVYWTRCENILTERYGPNGFKTAFDIVRRGRSDGLYGILKLVADRMVKHYAGNEISARVHQYVNSLSPDERDSAVDEYVSKYGHLLPEEWTEGSSVRINVNFPRILEKHPEIIHRMRSVGR